MFAVCHFSVWCATAYWTKCGRHLAPVEGSGAAFWVQRCLFLRRSVVQLHLASRGKCRGVRVKLCFLCGSLQEDDLCNKGHTPLGTLSWHRASGVKWVKLSVFLVSPSGCFGVSMPATITVIAWITQT